MKILNKITKKYSLSRLWTKDTYKGWETCLCGQASNERNNRKVARFDLLKKKNDEMGLTKREHCLILGYFKFFKTVGMLERVQA